MSTEEPSFLGLQGNTVVGLNIELFRAFKRMIEDVNECAATNDRIDDQVRKNQNVDDLFRKWPWLKFSNTYPGVGNHCTYLEWRISIWEEAHDQVGTRFVGEEASLVEIFTTFVREYCLGNYEFLPWCGRLQSQAEVNCHRAFILPQLFNWIVHLHTFELTCKQNQEMRDLCNWVKADKEELREKGFERYI